MACWKTLQIPSQEVNYTLGQQDRLGRTWPHHHLDSITKILLHQQRRADPPRTLKQSKADCPCDSCIPPPTSLWVIHSVNRKGPPHSIQRDESTGSSLLCPSCHSRTEVKPAAEPVLLKVTDGPRCLRLAGVTGVLHLDRLRGNVGKLRR